MRIAATKATTIVADGKPCSKPDVGSGKVGLGFSEVVGTGVGISGIGVSVGMGLGSAVGSGTGKNGSVLEK